MSLWGLNHVHSLIWEEGSVRKWFWIFALLICLITPHLVVAAEAPVAVETSPTPVPPDMVTLKDGGVLYGEVVEMSNGVLHFKTAAAADTIIKIKWANVEKLAINHPIPFHLKEGTVLIGTATEGPNGTINVKAEPLKGALEIPMDSIAAVNPLVQPPVIYVGTLSGGYSQATGNSQLRNASLLGDLVARSEQLRLTINGRYVYGDNDGELSARNARGTIKMDFFITKRFFWFASSYFEKDTFQDLKLRTALSSGPGYNFIEKGDYASPWLKDMSLYAEAGVSYFNEDYINTGDQTSLRGRWAVRLNWPILDERMTFFHYQEFYPSLQNTKDYFVTMDNGVRFKLFAGFVSGIQVTTRYNSAPTPGTGDTDNLYLLTLGYNFDTTRKR
jgi:putative salt-induced outer membrane protein YdiY